MNAPRPKTKLFSTEENPSFNKGISCDITQPIDINPKQLKKASLT